MTKMRLLAYSHIVVILACIVVIWSSSFLTNNCQANEDVEVNGGDIRGSRDLDEEDVYGGRRSLVQPGKPSTAPSSSQPSVAPSTAQPSLTPSKQPTTTRPSKGPSRAPKTSKPSMAPSLRPTFSTPTKSPSRTPSSARPSTTPSSRPTTSKPTKSPSRAPSTAKPSTRPSSRPTTSKPTESPSKAPTTSRPSSTPSLQPTSSKPSKSPTKSPLTSKPSHSPSTAPTTTKPSRAPSRSPSSSKPSKSPSEAPTSSKPSESPSNAPRTSVPSKAPSKTPTTSQPSKAPTSSKPSQAPSRAPASSKPSIAPVSSRPTQSPTKSPKSSAPSISPVTSKPSVAPIVPKTTRSPSVAPSKQPTNAAPTGGPSVVPSKSPITTKPTASPTNAPTNPTSAPTYRNKPNILILISDDLKPLLSSYNLPYVDETPNVQRIARKGVTFMNAHAQMSLCGPSRASFLTSLRPDKLQIFNINPNQLVNKIRKSRRGNRRIHTLPEWFKMQGYATFGAGKIFHENEFALYEAPNMWTEPVYTWLSNLQRPPTFKKPYEGTWIQFPDVEDAFYSDGQLADFAVNMIQTRLAQMEEPWMFIVGFWKPHLPFQCPNQYFSMSRDEIAPKAGNPNIKGIPSFWQSLIKGDSCGEVKLYSGIPTKSISYQSPEWVQRIATRSYRATVAYVDAQIGKVLNALEDTSLDAHTHIILLGDHGFHLGDKGIYCKHTNFEQGTRVPFMIAPAPRETSWDQSRGKRSYAPVELLDILPTIAEMNGLPLKYVGNDRWNWQGTSLVPILQDPLNGFVKPFALSQYPRGSGSAKRIGYTARTTRYRLTGWCLRTPTTIVDNTCFFETYDLAANQNEDESISFKDPQLRQTIMDNTFNWKQQQTGVFDPNVRVAPFDFNQRGNMNALPPQPFP